MKLFYEAILRARSALRFTGFFRSVERETGRGAPFAPRISSSRNVKWCVGNGAWEMVLGICALAITTARAARLSSAAPANTANTAPANFKRMFLENDGTIRELLGPKDAKSHEEQLFSNLTRGQRTGSGGQNPKTEIRRAGADLIAPPGAPE